MRKDIQKEKGQGDFASLECGGRNRMAEDGGDVRLESNDIGYRILNVG